MGNNDKDPLAHCQGHKHAKQYAKFKRAYLDRQERLRDEQRRQKQARAEQELLRLQQAQREEEARRQQQEETEAAQRRQQQEVEAARQRQIAQDEAARLRQQEAFEQAERRKREELAIAAANRAQHASSSNIITAPPVILIEPRWLDHALKGSNAYNGVPYGQIKMDADGLAKWRCLLCQSGWMPADDPFPLRHCQGRAHVANYKTLEEAVAEHKEQQVAMVAASPRPNATSAAREAKKQPSSSPKANQNESFDPLWLLSAPPGQDAYEDVVYGEERTGSNGKPEWRCLLCDSNWMTANGKDQPRHTRGSKHIKRYQILVQAYEAKNGSGQNSSAPKAEEEKASMARSTQKAVAIPTPPQPTYKTARGLGSPAIPSRPDSAPIMPASRNGFESPTPSMAASISSSFLDIDDQWLAAPPPGQDEYKNVLYGDRRELKGKLQWRCLLCDSNWMAANDKDQPRHTAGYKHRKNYARLLLAYHSLQETATHTVSIKPSVAMAAATPTAEPEPEHHTPVPNSAPNTGNTLPGEDKPTTPVNNVSGSAAAFKESWLCEPPKGQLAFENVPYGELRRDDKGQFLWKCHLCSSNWMVASDTNRAQHCRSKQHASKYRQLVEAFEERHLDDSSQTSEGEVGHSESRDSIPKTFEHTEQHRHNLSRRWGDFTSEAFTTADDTWLPVTIVDEREEGKNYYAPSSSSHVDLSYLDQILVCCRWTILGSVLKPNHA